MADFPTEYTEYAKYKQYPDTAEGHKACATGGLNFHRGRTTPGHSFDPRFTQTGDCKRCRWCNAFADPFLEAVYMASLGKEARE